MACGTVTVGAATPGGSRRTSDLGNPHLRRRTTVGPEVTVDRARRARVEATRRRRTAGQPCDRRCTPAPDADYVAVGGSTVTDLEASPVPPSVPPPFTDDDLARFRVGRHSALHHHLGAHLTDQDGIPGARVAVWAPHATAVAYVGATDAGEQDPHDLEPWADTGIWHGFVPDVSAGQRYRLRLTGPDGAAVDHADPFAAATVGPTGSASRLWDPAYTWGDEAWLASRAGRQDPDAPLAIYELHLGSWRRHEDGRPLSYQELAEPLVDHVTSLGFTHVEFLPVMEHPFEGSWGYQSTGYFAPSARQGSPQDLMALIDRLHQAGIGVILDWVPSHVGTDAWGLARFDGTPLYEHADPKRAVHPVVGSAMFDHGRPEVRSFLLSSANCWLERYHVDGLRIADVSSLLYLDYARGPGEWEPNEQGGNEYLEAIAFLRDLNDEVAASHPGVTTIAESRSTWPGVTRPTADGGLGFGYVWDHGWRNDTLAYLGLDPLARQYHHERLTYRSVYRADERFCLPLSHDEVGGFKGALVDRFPGDDWQQRATLRLLLGLQFTSPGKKLVFMGDEFGQRCGWDVEAALDWEALEDERHAGLFAWTRDLAAAYRDLPALHRGDGEVEGFRWVDASDHEQSVVAFLRQTDGANDVLVVCNFTPVVRPGYRLGVPAGGTWSTVLDSDAPRYGGSGASDDADVVAEDMAMHGHNRSVALTLPPLAVRVLTPS
jgi:1,4-alpha-glucan branching enzyme